MLYGTDLVFWNRFKRESSGNWGLLFSWGFDIYFSVNEERMYSADHSAAKTLQHP